VGRTWVELGTKLSIWWVPGLLALLVLVLYLPWKRAWRKLSGMLGSGT